MLPDIRRSMRCAVLSFTLGVLAWPAATAQLATASTSTWFVDTASTKLAADLRAAAASSGATRIRPVGAVSLDGLRTAVLDGDTPRVLYFDSQGTLERTVDLPPARTGPRARPHQLMRISGDTIAALAFGQAYVLDPLGNVVRTFNAAELRTPVAQRLRWVLASLTGGRTVLALAGPQQQPSPDTPRWVDSIAVVIVDSGMTIVKELGRWPAMYLEARNGRPRQVWFAPGGAVTARDSLFYYGFGSDYRIDAYTSTGRLQRSFVRPWTRVPVTPADIDDYIEGWGKNWIKGTPVEVEREKRDMKADPFFSYVPAFSELLVATSGELWVRSPSLKDAQSAGELYDMPLAPSHWSVFDRDGRRIGEATLPAHSHPRDVRDGHVLTVEDGPNAGKVVRRKLERVRP
jgi:hypothetical protein